MIALLLHICPIALCSEDIGSADGNENGGTDDVVEQPNSEITTHAITEIITGYFYIK